MQPAEKRILKTYFVLHGTIYQCKKFITKYKTLTGKWISRKYGLAHPLKQISRMVHPDCDVLGKFV